MCDAAACGDGGCGGGAGSLPQAPKPQGGLQERTCIKCKDQPAQVLLRLEPLCHACLGAQLQAKASTAVRMNKLVQPGDRLALALSGGACSAAALHFITALRNPRGDRPERGKVPFSLEIVHVDESAAWRVPPEEAAAARTAVAASAEQYLVEGAVRYHCVPLEDVFAPAEAATPEQRQERLQQLLQSVPDPTGREDLVSHLRARLLLATAARLGCGKLARGDCATRLAEHIVADAAKGRGYGLPGDVHFVDARHGPGGPVVVYPLREIGRPGLEQLWEYKQLGAAVGTAGSGGTGSKSGRGGSSINALAAGFVETLLAHNPGSVSNILGTISKLQAFPWNEPPQHKNQQKGPGRQRAGQQAAAEASGEPAQPAQREVLCPVCGTPLADDELAATAAACSSAAAPDADGCAPPPACCSSCRWQILGVAPAGHTASGSSSGAGAAAAAAAQPGSAVSSLLPEAVQQQMHRLAAAEARAAAAGSMEGPGQEGEANVDSGGREGSTAEALRAQIAEFLLEDEDEDE